MLDLHNKDCFECLVKRSNQLLFPLPTVANKVCVLGRNPKIQAEIVQHARGAGIVVHNKVLKLVDEFLSLKLRYGTRAEKAVYAGMSGNAFLKRLILKRAVCFRGRYDSSVLRDGRKPASIDWMRVGQENEGEIKLEDYLSYDEMQISALVGASTPTFFINNGSRKNRAIPFSDECRFERYGIIVGMVGPRFEKPGRMENEHMIEPRTPSNREKILDIWTRFYGSKLYESCDLVPLKNLYSANGSRVSLNVKLYKTRISILAETLLGEANYQGSVHNLSVFLHIVGFGLGIWKVHETQESWFVEAFLETLQTLDLPYIKVCHFSWFKSHVVTRQTVLSKSGNQIQIESSKRNTADSLEKKSAEVGEKLLLVTTFAWNSNSFPGNDFWIGQLQGSSDPAAMCCSTAAELLNPLVNPFVENIRVY